MVWLPAVPRRNLVKRKIIAGIIALAALGGSIAAAASTPMTSSAASSAALTYHFE
jgi:hypothetical protein